MEKKINKMYEEKKQKKLDKIQQKHDAEMAEIKKQNCELMN